jgi:hypothetical protein
MIANLKTYNRIAHFYDLLDLPFEYFRYKSLRRVLFDGLSGRLLDAGVGTGRNFPFYPDGSRLEGTWGNSQGSGKWNLLKIQ